MKWTWIGLGLGGWLFLMLASDWRDRSSWRRSVTTLLALAAVSVALFLPDVQAELVEAPLAVAVLALLLLMLWVGSHAGRPATARPADSDRLAEDDAYTILGLAPGASAAAVKDAHRRLMKQYHPDHGGTVETAARINAARERILGQAASR